MSNNILVSICCLSYNHGKFLRECLDGFLMQKTNFEFEVLIHDDASKDDSAEIIREYEKKYPEIIKPIYQTENQYSKGVSVTRTFNFPRAKGKYIAMCEGDDYWTDPNKLQKQVDILENNSQINLVVGGYNIVNEDTKKSRNVFALNNPSNISQGFEFSHSDFLNKWLTKTLTIMFRSEVYRSIKFPEYKYFRDVHMNFHLLLSGNGYYINECLGVYREHTGGIHSLIGEKNQQLGYYKVYKELFHFYPDLVRDKYINVLYNLYNFQKNNTIEIVNNYKIKTDMILSAKSPQQVSKVISVFNISNKLFQRIIFFLYRTFR